MKGKNYNMLKLNEMITVNREVEITNSSKKYIHCDFFKGYEDFIDKTKQVYELWKEITGTDTCIIYMYPAKDDISSACLLFRTIIHNVSKSEYIDYGLYESILLDIKGVKVQTFKDLSTVITIYNGCKIGNESNGELMVHEVFRKTNNRKTIGQKSIKV